MRPTSLTSSGCRPCTPASYAACSPVSMICVSTSLRDLLTTSSMRPGMDASVGHELLEREPRDLAAHRIEARHDDRVGRVVDDDVDAGRELERANVSALAADDAPLHFVVRQRDGRHRASPPCDPPRFAESPARRSSSLRARRFAWRTRESRGCGWPRRPAPPPPCGGSARSWRPARTCPPSARGDGARRRPASRAPASRSATVFSRRPKSLARWPRSLSRCSRSSNLRSSTFSRSTSRRSSRSTSSRRPRTSTLELLAELDQLFLAGDDRALPEVLRLALGVADDSSWTISSAVALAATCRATFCLDRRSCVLQ